MNRDCGEIVQDFVARNIKMMKKSLCCTVFVFLRLEMLFSGKHVKRALPMLFTWGNFGSHIF